MPTMLDKWNQGTARPAASWKIAVLEEELAKALAERDRALADLEHARMDNKWLCRLVEKYKVER